MTSSSKFEARLHNNLSELENDFERLLIGLLRQMLNGPPWNGNIVSRSKSAQLKCVLGT